MNKKEAKLQLIKVEKERDKLLEIINKPIDLFKTVKNYSDVCEELGEIEKTESDFFSKKEYKFHQLQNIAKLFNRDNKTNYYYPYFVRKGSGLVFYVSSYVVSVFSGQVAYFKDRTTSDFVGKTFIDIYTDLL